jgi:hypothetical protein
MNSFQTKLKVKTIKADLRDLPKGLAAYDTAYDDAMSRIFCQELDFQESARKILSIVLCAKRPLRTRELQHALMVEPDTTELDQDDNLEVEDILSVCAGLITTDTGSGTIRFVHYTTQEYLQRKQKQWLPRGEFEIARVCLDYLLMQIGSFERNSTGHGISKNTCPDLVEYAIQYGSFHWNSVVQGEKALHNGLLRLLRGPRPLCNIVPRIFSRLSRTNKMFVYIPVHWVAELGLLELTRFCIINNLAMTTLEVPRCFPMVIGSQSGASELRCYVLLKRGTHRWCNYFWNTMLLSIQETGMVGFRLLLRLMVATSHQYGYCLNTTLLSTQETTLE